MPARDFHHDAVRSALIKDGWTITHDPFPMPFGSRTVYVDFGAEAILAAERGNERIAVEVKGFHGPSEVHDLEQALGQFVLYLSTLKRYEPERQLFLAVPREIGEGLFKEPPTMAIIEDYGINYVIYDAERQEIVQWKPWKK
jgi:hypothetical protein